MVNVRMANDPTMPEAMGPDSKLVQMKSSTTYNEPGLPKPPGGWGKVVGIKDLSDNDDAGPESPDQYR